MRIVFNFTFSFVFLFLFEGCCDNCDCGDTPTAYEFPFFCYVYEKTTNESIVGRCLKCPYSNELSSLINQFGDTIKSYRTIDTDGY